MSLGTRFLCSDDTKLFDIEWPDAAHRVLRHRIVDEWLAAGSPASGRRTGEGEMTGKMPVGEETIELLRYGIFMPMEGFEGDLDSSVLYAGESCSLVSDVRPAADLVAALAAAADAICTAAR